MPRTDYNNQSTLDDEDFVISTDETSNDEEDDLSAAFTTKFDEDWKPYSKNLSIPKHPRPVRKAAKKILGGVKIFSPNTGLQASNIVSKDHSQKSRVAKKMNIAISSSSEDED